MPARTPDELPTLFGDLLNAGDATAVAALYEDDAILVSDPKRIVKGRAAILEGLINFLAIKPKLTLNAARVVRNGDLAVLYSDWTITGASPDGSQMSVNVRPTLLARQQADGTWRVVIDDPSVDESTPPAP